jgi:HEAT repeat protein
MMDKGSYATHENQELGIKNEDRIKNQEARPRPETGFQSECTAVRNTLVLMAGLILVIAAAVVFLRRIPAPQDSKAPPVPTVTPPPPKAVPIPEAFEQAKAILGAGDRSAIRSLAVDCRKRARQDAEFRKRLALTVLDETATPSVRELAAFVLGSIQDKEGLDTLARALQEARDPQCARTLLLALGCDKTWTEDDDIFDLPDSPRVIVSPLGLAVRIRGRLDDPDLRGTMVARTLSSEAAEVRWAAALALADSASFPDVRSGFLAALPGERDPATEGEIAKALSDWAAVEPGDSAERMRAVAALIDGAARPEAAALRLRSEDGLKRMAWTTADVRALAPRLEEGSLDQRRWAIAVLAGAASRAETPDRDLVFDSLARISSSATEPKVREFAVTGLSEFRDRAGAEKALVAALSDPAWHVRAAAVRGLGRRAGSEDVRSALERVERTDADERVRRAAGELRKR